MSGFGNIESKMVTYGKIKKCLKSIGKSKMFFLLKVKGTRWKTFFWGDLAGEM